MPTILIVDDELIIRILIREILAIHPLLSFFEAEDGQQALDLVGTHPPDLILLDATMPKLDGAKVCQAIKSNPTLKSTHITLVTALDKDQALVKDASACADDYLAKPFAEKELWEVVTRALHINPV